jgi:hypothetical protein
MTAAARVRDDESDPLEGLDWSCEWGSPAASRLFAAVRELCGVSVTREPLTGGMAQQALADARAILDRLDDDIVAEEEAIEDWIEDFDEPGAWDPSNFRRHCAGADARARTKRAPKEIRRAPRATREALMYSLRRDVGALGEPDTRRRLAELSDDQALEVAARLQRLDCKIARAWSPDEIEALIKLRETLR